MVGTRAADVETLLHRCDEDVARVEQSYKASLQSQHVRSDLQVDIKNLCGNLRSVLDYLAHDIRETHCPTAPKARFYFPILDSRAAFEGQVRNWYPGLDTAAPDLFAYLERVQPYHPAYSWVGAFNRINNENKHGNLVAQTRVQTEQVRVATQGGGQVNWSPQNVRFGSGVSIGGIPVDPRTQMPLPDPSLRVERIIWVDFRFEGENVSALGLLREAVTGVRAISKEIQQWL